MITVRADHGGGPKHIANLLKGLFSKFEFYVACPNEEPYFNIFSKRAICVEIPHRKFSVSAFLGLVKLIHSKNIDIIHSHGKGAGLYSRLLGLLTGKAVIHTFHGFHYQQLSEIKRQLYLNYELIFSHFTKGFINVSQSEQSECIKVNIFERSKSFVVPNGVELPSGKKSIILNKPIRIVNISRLSREKNIDDLIKIISMLKRDCLAVEVKIVGDGPQRSELEMKARQYGVSDIISFLGFRDNVDSILKSSDIYLTTSRGEGLPLSVMEAMAHFLPVVASRVPGHTDLIQHGRNGFIFDLDKPEDASKFIINLATEPSLFNLMAKNAHETIKDKYSTEAMCERIAEIYNLSLFNANSC